MWNFEGVSIQTQWLNFEPVRVLFEFDIPFVFICKDQAGNTYLAYLCGQDHHRVRYLIVPCDVDLEQRLVTGKINLRDALTQNRGWIFDLNNEWEPIGAWKVNVDNLPGDTLPRPGVMPFAHLQRVVNASKARAWANEFEFIIPADQGDRTYTSVLHG